MGLVQDAMGAICIATNGKRSSYRGQWICASAWMNIIYNKTEETYAARVITKAFTELLSRTPMIVTPEVKQEDCVIHVAKFRVKTGTDEQGVPTKSNERFYYIQMSGQSIPEITSNISFWNKRYDECAKKYRPTPPRNKKRSSQEKRKACGEEDAETKRARVVDNSDTSTTDPTERFATPPTTRSRALEMCSTVWKKEFSHIEFPIELLEQREDLPSAVDDEPGETIAPAHHEVTPDKCGRYDVGDWPLSNGHTILNVPKNYAVVTKHDLGKYKKQRDICNALKSSFHQKQACCPQEGQYIHAAFAAAHPKIVPQVQETLIALSRYVFLLSVRAKLETPSDMDDQLGLPSSSLLHSITLGSPCASSIDLWVKELAVLQSTIASHEIEHAKSVFLQCDGGPDGSLVKLLTWYDPKENKIQEYNFGIEKCGKTAADTAFGVSYAIEKVFCLSADKFKLTDLANDSGAGTPESLARSLITIGRMNPEGDGDSCEHHDLQSILRLPTEHFIGLGAVDNRNGVQCVHERCLRSVQML
jgi:hypothetical protein